MGIKLEVKRIKFPDGIFIARFDGKVTDDVDVEKLPEVSLGSIPGQCLYRIDKMKFHDEHAPAFPDRPSVDAYIQRVIDEIITKLSEVGLELDKTEPQPSKDSKESPNKASLVKKTFARKEVNIPMEWVNFLESAKSLEEFHKFSEMYEEYRVEEWVKENWKEIKKIEDLDEEEDKKWLEEIRGKLDLNSLEDRLLFAKAKEILESSNTEKWFFVTHSENMNRAHDNSTKEFYKELLEDQLRNRNPPAKDNKS